MKHPNIFLADFLSAAFSQIVHRIHSVMMKRSFQREAGADQPELETQTLKTSLLILMIKTFQLC